MIESESAPPHARLLTAHLFRRPPSPSPPLLLLSSITQTHISIFDDARHNIVLIFCIGRQLNAVADFLFTFSFFVVVVAVVFLLFFNFCFAYYTSIRSSEIRIPKVRGCTR